MHLTSRRRHMTCPLPIYEGPAASSSLLLGSGPETASMQASSHGRQQAHCGVLPSPSAADREEALVGTRCGGRGGTAMPTLPSIKLALRVSVTSPAAHGEGKESHVHLSMVGAGACTKAQTFRLGSANQQQRCAHLVLVDRSRQGHQTSCCQTTGRAPAQLLTSRGQSWPHRARPRHNLRPSRTTIHPPA